MHDVNAIDADAVSEANRMTIGGEAMTKFRKNVSSALSALSAFKSAGKQ